MANGIPMMEKSTPWIAIAALVLTLTSSVFSYSNDQAGEISNLKTEVAVLKNSISEYKNFTQRIVQLETESAVIKNKMDSMHQTLEWIRNYLSNQTADEASVTL